MEEFYNNYAGSIHEDKIPDYVVAVCVINATLRTEGVLELAGGIQDTISENLLEKELFSKGIKVEQNTDGIVIDVYVILRFGVRIPEVAWNIQESVKNKVEAMIERPVRSVNIHIQGVRRNEAVYEETRG